MTKIYTKSDFINGKIAIHTPTQKKFDKLIKRLEKVGLSKDKRATDWLLFKNLTCVHCLGKHMIWCCDKKTEKQVNNIIIKPHQINFTEEKIKKELTEHIRKAFLEGETILDFGGGTVKLLQHDKYDYNIDLERCKTIKITKGDDILIVNKDNFDTVFDEYPQLSEKEGTRAWAFKMLEVRIKIRHISWFEGSYLYKDEDDTICFFQCEKILKGWENIVHKDGWELYKPKYITKHSELLKLHGRKVICKINGEFVDDARISVFKNCIFICHNCDKYYSRSINKSIRLEYKYSAAISVENMKYEEGCECGEIQLLEPTKEEKLLNETFIKAQT